MSSSVYVVDAAFKRTLVKVTPGKYLREVLEDVCKAKKINPEEYTLKTQSNKPVDLSQPFRLSGLSAGAKLQLVQASRSAGVVSVALQLPESEGGTRLSDKFPSSTSIWLVLRKFEEGVAGEQGKKLNLTQRGAPSGSSGAGRLLYEQPSLNVMGRNLENFTDLQKTLAQLGFNNGSVMLRLNFKLSEQHLEDAMQEITQYFQAVDGVPAGIGSSVTQEAHGAHADGEGSMSSLPDASALNGAGLQDDQAGPEPNEDVEMTPAPPTQPSPLPEGEDVIASSTETPQQPQSSTSSPPDGISVYRPPSNSTPAAALAPDDPAIYEPNIAHAKAHQAALERAGRNTRLLSDKELAEQEAARQASLATVQNVTFRVRYPDQSMIETSLSAAETGGDLYAKVRETLEHNGEPFELRYLSAKGHAALPDSSSQRLIRDLGFRGKVLVNFGWSASALEAARGAPALREEYRSRAQELKVELATPESEHDPAGSAGNAAKPEGVRKENKGKNQGDMEAKMKKFLGFGKK